MALHVVILAAGLGKRMYSDTPKVLHPVGDKPMLVHVIEAAQKLAPAQVHVVVGHGREKIMEQVNLPVHWIHQLTQSGTGHAVMQALPHIPDDSEVLILCGDVPLIRVDTLQQLLPHAKNSFSEKYSSLGLLTAHLSKPFGLGRILRSEGGEIQAIVEEADATDLQRQIQEIYTGICCANANELKRWLPQLTPKNAQQELYLTDIVGMAVTEQLPVRSVTITDENEIQGVNNRAQLQQVERAYQARIVHQLMVDGTTFADATRVDVRGTLTCGRDVLVDIDCIFNGNVVLGNRAHIGAHCILKNVIIGDDCDIMPYSILEDCTVEAHGQIGPFARIRPGSHFAPHCKIGNFVEVKNAQFGTNSKANHLSYIGDTLVGSDVNIGAGTITCNYDGANKHQTIIEDGAFIGSDTQLVAPVTIGKNATIGAGSTIRKSAPAGELTLTSSQQKTITGWVRPKKQPKS